MKKFMSLMLVCVMVLSCFLQVTANTVFEDVSIEHFAYDAVQYFYGADVINGVGDNLFAPDDLVTREQFAKMISIIYNKESFVAKEQTFSDVTSDMWSYKYIESVKEYLTGYYPEGGKAFFNPVGKATREDVAYALVKIGGLAEKYKTDLSVLENYEDGQQISVNLKEYVALAVATGLMQGYENKLRPQDGITRAEAATLLFRAIKKPVESEQTNKKDDEEINKEPKEPKNPEENQKANNQENAIYSNQIGYFEILGTESENITVNSSARLDGNVKIVFGEDAIKDTKLIMEVIVDGKDKYYIESTSVSNYEIKNNNYVVIDLICSAYKNGDLIVEQSLPSGRMKRRVVVDKKNDELNLGGTVNFIANELNWSNVKLPKEPEITENNFDDASAIHYKVFVKENETGLLTYKFVKDTDLSALNASFESDGKKYEIALIKEISKENGNLKGKFKIMCDGEIVNENIVCEIINFDGEVGDYAQFVSENGSVDVKLQIVEKNI